MKPTLSNIEKRIETIENHKVVGDNAPSLTLIFNREDGTPGEIWRCGKPTGIAPPRSPPKPMNYCLVSTDNGEPNNTGEP